LKPLAKAVWPILFMVSALHATDSIALLTPEEAKGEWAPLLNALAAKGPVQASFTERRFFPFRHDPTILSGVLRVSHERGLSLQYIEPAASVLIADSSGILLRDETGHDRAMPADSRQAGAIASLLPIMRFDLPALFPRFDIRAQRMGPDWRFEFSSKDPVAAEALGLITVVGTGDDVRHLQFKRSERQRIEIDVEGTRAGTAFTAEELRQFFR
jgi:hypothetical protein